MHTPGPNKRPVDLLNDPIVQVELLRTIRHVSMAQSVYESLRIDRRNLELNAIITMSIQLLSNNVVKSSVEVPLTWWDAVLERWVPKRWQRGRWAYRTRTIETERHAYFCPHTEIAGALGVRGMMVVPVAEHMDFLRFGAPSLRPDDVRHRLYMRAYDSPDCRMNSVSGAPDIRPAGTFKDVVAEVMRMLQEERRCAIGSGAER